MKHFLLLFIALSSQFNLLASVSDSLKKVLETASTENERFEILTQLGEAYLVEMDFEKAENSANEILRLSNSKNKQYNATASHLLGRIYLRNGQVKKGDSIYQSSIKALKTTQEKYQAKLAWQLYNYGNFLKNVGNYEKAIIYFDESYMIQKKLGDKPKQGDCLLNSGAMYLYLGQNKEAENLLNKAYVIALEVKDTSSLNTITTNMASVYEIKGDYPGALYQLELSEKYATSAFDLAYIYGNRGNLYFYLGKLDSSIYAYQKSSGYFIESGRMLENGMVLMELGVIFKNQKKYDQAFKMFRKSEKVFKDASNNDLLTAVLINKGDAFKELNQSDSAIYNYKVALTYAEETNNNNYLGICNQAISILLIEHNELKEALDYMNKALFYFTEMNDQRLLAEAYNSLTEIYTQLKKYSLADKFLQKSLKITNSLDHLELKTISYDNYIKLNAMRLNAPEIYHYHSEQIRLLDSLKSETNSKMVEDLSAQYHLKETEDSLKMIQLSLDRQEVITSAKQKQLTFSVIGLVVFSILLVFVYLSRKKVKEKNKENELLLGEIHHRVKNNLQVISSLLSLQERNITDVKAKSAILEGKERVQSMGLIHKLLYQKNNFAGIEMKEYVEKLVDGLLDSFGKSKEEVDVSIDFSKINLDVDTAIPIGLMINELVINSLKYAYENTKKPSLSIQIREENKQLILEVEDNGTGEVEDVTKSKSFGLKLIRSLSRQLSGAFDVEKRIGLCFTIRMNDYKIID